NHPDHGGQVRWNFEKFLIDKKGNVIGHYPSKVKPEDADLKAAIDKALKAE
ncbi:MAG: glutathione peroxidase, partial [Verrucomicrobia bacterium]|nr:glutathione peroxidase [Verrucomicrobiota bacterium]